MLSDRFAKMSRELFETIWFWSVVAAIFIGYGAYRNRRALKTRFRIWRLRRVGGTVNEDVVEQLFYRAARLAAGRLEKRRPGQTWREWIFGLPDRDRRSILTRALEVFEKSKYGRLPVTSSEFQILEETIRELKL